MFIRGFDQEAFEAINWSWYTGFWLFMAIIMAGIRHLAYMWRIRMLSGITFSWKLSYVVIMLWEFASAATPSIVGGSAFALYILSKEGLSTGRSTTIVLFTAFLDELFFIIAAPLFFILAGKSFIFPDPSAMEVESLQSLNSLIYLFVIGYIGLLGYTILLAYGLFINPRGLKWLILKVFKIKFLRRWRKDAVSTGDEVIVSSKELQSQKFNYYFKAFFATVLSWSARYFTINCIILAFAPIDNHFIVYARQVVMWIIMLIPLTPGSSGIAEITFNSFLIEYIPKGLGASLAFIWRLISYYPYLFIGVIILPRWLRKVYSRDYKI